MRRNLALIAACMMASTAASADEITDQLDQAKTYCDDGDVAGAIGELELVLQAMRGRVASGYLASFPTAPEGWAMQEDDDAQAGAAPFVGTMLQRTTYRQDGGDGSIEAQLMTGGGFMQGLAAMLMSPQVMAAQPNARRIRVGRESAVVTFDSVDRSGQVMLDPGGKVSIMLQGSGLATADPLVELINRWDLKKVEEVAGS